MKRFVILMILLVTRTDTRLVTFVDEFNYWINTDYVNGKAWVDYEKNDHNKYRVCMEGSVIKDGVNSVIMNIKLIKINEKKKNETTKLIDVTFDVCATFRKQKGDVFTKYMIKFFQQYGRIPMRCPVKTGEYYIHNATINGFEFPGQNFYSGNAFMQIKFQIWTKVQKKLVTVIKGDFNGGYKNV